MNGPLTLGIDVGGSGIKAAVLDADATMLTERVRIPTPYPCPPERLVSELVELRASMPAHDRVSLGFPGLIRSGRVRYVVALARTSFEGEHSPELAAQWKDFPIEVELTKAFSSPVRVANDADVQGCGAVEGVGFEFVMTLGTGIGGALFHEGRLLPHLELGHAPLFTRESVEDVIGNAGRRRHGNAKWNEFVLVAIEAYRRYLFFDTIYIGGGNAKHLDSARLPADARVVSNSMGITGGVRLWELDVRALP